MQGCTEPRLLSAERELINQELRFHRPEPATSREMFAAMIADDFWEVGASGRLHTRDFVLDTLVERAIEPVEEKWQTSNFHCQEIAADNFLLTYSLTQGKRTTRRSSLWRLTAQGWRIVYHQGTLVSAS